MPKCARCGAKMVLFETEPDGLCKSCRNAVFGQKDELKRAVVRAENLDVCRRRCAKPNIQRIFDGFIAKYPDALLTGISVQDGGDKLLIYLDGKPMYYATFNPLTSSVDLTGYHDVMAKADIQSKEAADQASRDKNAGCSVWLSVVGIIYGAVCLLLSPAGGLAGLVFSLVVLAGGIAKSKVVVILGGVLSLVSVFLGFPYTILFALFGIFYICVGAEM